MFSSLKMTAISEYEMGRIIGAQLRDFAPVTGNFQRTRKREDETNIVDSFFSLGDDRVLVVLVQVTESGKEFIFVPVYDLDLFLSGFLSVMDEMDDVLQFFPHKPLMQEEGVLYFVESDVLDIPSVTYNTPFLTQKSEYAVGTADSGERVFVVPIVSPADRTFEWNS